MQYMVDTLGGEVVGAEKREYGFSELSVRDGSDIFFGIDETTRCWMSHGDSIGRLPEGFRITASTPNTDVAAIKNTDKQLYGLQFHPEVVHTPEGKKMLENFLFRICRCKKTWTMKSFVRDAIEEIRSLVGNRHVILGLSGGVDSSVAALLLHQAIGNQLTCIFVDNGLLRLDEAKRVKNLFKKHFRMNVKFVNAKKPFLNGLKGVSNPEKKRKIIGRVFIEVFEKEARGIKGVQFLSQGTLYPDIIESRSAFGGPSAVIKSHHNVGGLPEIMKLDLIEPLRELFKDEVRELGLELGLPEEAIYRQPFPGPGLAVRIIGAVDAFKIRTLQAIDEIFIQELRKWDLYDKTWQAFAVLLPIQSVGVMGDERTYANVCALRAVNSVDGMTADWTELPFPFLKRVSNRIINEVDGVNRVVYDISSKPPATIEWE
jgi:GMP synthase (glutamine-hydrolysing)